MKRSPAAKAIPFTVEQGLVSLPDMFAKAGRLDDWNAGLRTFLEDRFEDAARVLASGRPGNIPGKFTTSLFGDKRSRAVMQAAMSRRQFQGFRKLMEVFEAAARTLPEGAPTATDAIGAQALRSRYGAIGRGAAAMFSPQNLGTLVGRAFGEFRAGRQLDVLAARGGGRAGTAQDTQSEVGTRPDDGNCLAAECRRRIAPRRSAAPAR